jgi:hypothetical protein
LTTGVERSELSIMGQEPTSTTTSLDDGIPFYPTMTAIAESPLVEGLLYAGTDDGNVAVSHDAGASWTQVGDRLPGIPSSAWVNAIEPSHFEENTVYVVVNNYRNDDYANYLYVSRDAGTSWASIASNIPHGRVLRVVREDPRNPKLLYVGAEIGLFLSIDAGETWVEHKSNMPTLAFNDLVIHPRDNDLVLATHGRGIWILDNVNALQEMNDEVLASDAHLFTIEPAEMTRLIRVKAQPGDMVFSGKNPPAGAIIDYYLKDDVDEDDISLRVLDSAGSEVQLLEVKHERGVHRVVWDLRYEKLPDPAAEEPDQFGEPREGAVGPRVVPGEYTVRLELSGTSYEQTVRVDEDARIQVTPAARRTWTRTLLELASMYRETNGWVETFFAGRSEDDDPGDDEKLVRELRRRIGILYRQISGWTGTPTADQKTQVQFLTDAMDTLSPGSP